MSQGDVAGLGNLYDQLGGHLFALAHRMTNRGEDAEKIVEDVFLTVWAQAGRFDSSRHDATTWLVNLARARSLEHLRARRRILLKDAGPPEETPDPSPAFGENRPASERAELSAEWIGELTTDQRRAIELAFFEGLTHPEIAARLNATIGAVKSRIRLGLDRLRSRKAGGMR